MILRPNEHANCNFSFPIDDFVLTQQRILRIHAQISCQQQFRLRIQCIHRHISCQQQFPQSIFNHSSRTSCQTLHTLAGWDQNTVSHCGCAAAQGAHCTCMRFCVYIALCAYCGAGVLSAYLRIFPPIPPTPILYTSAYLRKRAHISGDILNRIQKLSNLRLLAQISAFLHRKLGTQCRLGIHSAQTAHIKSARFHCNRAHTCAYSQLFIPTVFGRHVPVIPVMEDASG